jgi:hypothetical protein
MTCHRLRMGMCFCFNERRVKQSQVISRDEEALSSIACEAAKEARAAWLEALRGGVYTSSHRDPLAPHQRHFVAGIAF